MKDRRWLSVGVALLLFGAAIWVPWTWLKDRATAATLSAVIVSTLLGLEALIHDRLKLWMDGPRLLIRTGTDIPYSLVGPSQEWTTYDSQRYDRQQWVRLAIHNIGDGTATHVEVRLDAVWRVGTIAAQMDEFFPETNLRWANGLAENTGHRVLDRIPPRARCFCELGSRLLSASGSPSPFRVDLTPLVPEYAQDLQEAGAYYLEVTAESAEGATAHAFVELRIGDSPSDATVEVTLRRKLPRPCRRWR